MSMLRLLNVQGIAGLAAGIALALLLVLQKFETRRWRKQSAQFEQLYVKEQAALAGTVSNYRAAADAARVADEANRARVAADQQIINERTRNDFEERIAAARLAARRLREPSAGAAADPRGGATTPVPGPPAAAAGPAEAAGKNGLPLADRLIATEQAIQLDELIKWVRAQHQVDPQRSR